MNSKFKSLKPIWGLKKEFNFTRWRLSVVWSLVWGEQTALIKYKQNVFISFITGISLHLPTLVQVKIALLVWLFNSQCERHQSNFEKSGVNAPLDWSWIAFLFPHVSKMFAHTFFLEWESLCASFRPRSVGINETPGLRHSWSPTNWRETTSFTPTVL